MVNVDVIAKPELFEIPIPDVSNLVTEDDTPVDSIFSERQMHLLTDALYASWTPPVDARSFVAMANVAIYAMTSQPPLVPNVLVSLDIQLPEDLFEKGHRCYFIWLYGKPPDVVIEIVSNRVGGELSDKLRGYERLRVPYYVVYDPERHLSEETLYIYELRGGSYAVRTERWLPSVGLGVTIWPGDYRGFKGDFLRWCDIDGELYPTGVEAALAAQQQADSEREQALLAWQQVDAERAHAEQEQQRAEKERQRAEQLAAQLRALGVEVD